MTAIGSRNDIFLKEMGLDPLWTRRVTGQHLVVAEATSVIAPLPLEPIGTASADVADMDWATLHSAVANCSRCGLCQSRARTVFGSGDPSAAWLFVGEGPDVAEDLQGSPLVDAAGRLFDNMLLAMNLQRDVNVFVANIVKCRPTDVEGRDRSPSPDESVACLPYLERQIALIKPRVIVAMGRTAALSLLKMDQSALLESLRGTVHQYANVPLVVTYHPAHLLRKLDDKSKAWRDLSLAMHAYSAHSTDVNRT